MNPVSIETPTRLVCAPATIGIRLGVIYISILLLIPCFWQRRIQAGDLSSHIYNSWLAQQIESGKAPGLTVQPLTTNVLFDLMLSRLFRSFGAEPAQRIAVSVSVLVFFWGAFALACVVNARRPWFILPCIGMLTYGWVFHEGFFNFHLALGLCLWAMAFLRSPSAKSRLLGLAFLAIAYTGHPLPPLWAAAVLIYLWAAEQIGARGGVVLFTAALLAIIGLNFWLRAHFITEGSVPLEAHLNYRVWGVSALDQVWVFGVKYWLISGGLALLWGFLLLRISHVEGIAELVKRPLFSVCVLMAAGILLLPTKIDASWYRAPLSLIIERITLMHATLICVFLARADPPVWQKVAFVPLALLYFSFIYADTREVNKIESRIEELARPLSSSDRVVGSIEAVGSRIQPFSHTIDRVCVGKCLSYGNYEPFTLQFRVQTLRDNPFVVANLADFEALRVGAYRVKDRDLPMYEIGICGSGPCIRPLHAGASSRRHQFAGVPVWWWGRK